MFIRILLIFVFCPRKKLSLLITHYTIFNCHLIDHFESSKLTFALQNCLEGFHPRHRPSSTLFNFIICHFRLWPKCAQKSIQRCTHLTEYYVIQDCSSVLVKRVYEKSVLVVTGNCMKDKFGGICSEQYKLIGLYLDDFKSVIIHVSFCVYWMFEITHPFLWYCYKYFSTYLIFNL